MSPTESCERKSSGKNAAVALIDEDNKASIQAVRQLNKTPVTIDEFVESDEFLGTIVEVWPTLRSDLRAMNPDVLVGGSPIHEALLGGATGTGKTTLSIVINLYQLYLLTCFRSAQVLFGLAPHTRSSSCCSRVHQQSLNVSFSSPFVTCSRPCRIRNVS